MQGEKSSRHHYNVSNLPSRSCHDMKTDLNFQVFVMTCRHLSPRSECKAQSSTAMSRYFLRIRRRSSEFHFVVVVKVYGDVPQFSYMQVHLNGLIVLKSMGFCLITDDSGFSGGERNVTVF